MNSFGNIGKMFLLCAALVGLVWSLVTLGKQGQWFPFIGVLITGVLATPKAVEWIKGLL